MTRLEGNRNATAVKYLCPDCRLIKPGRSRGLKLAKNGSLRSKTEKSLRKELTFLQEIKSLKRSRPEDERERPESGSKYRRRMDIHKTACRSGFGGRLPGSGRTV